MLQRIYPGHSRTHFLYSICVSTFVSLCSQITGEMDTYSVQTRVPSMLPIADIEADSPAADDSLKIVLGEVCFA